MMVSLFVGPVYWLSQIYVWKMLYAGKELLYGFSLDDMIRYFCLMTVPDRCRPPDGDPVLAGIPAGHPAFHGGRGMSRCIRMFITAVRINIAQSLAYRANSIGGAVIGIAGELLLPLMTALIYRAGTSFPGWRLEEALILQGILIRPAPTAFVSMMLSLNLEDLTIFISGAAVVLISAQRLGLAASAGPAAGAVVLFLAGLAAMFGFSLLMSATMFKWVGNSRIGEIYESIAGFGRYPTQVFPGILRPVITYALPVALLGALPAEVILGKAVLPPAGLAIILLCGAGFVLAAYAVWRLMIRRYSSSGG